MAIALDASTPATVESAGPGPLNTASFTPPSGSLVVALTAGGWGDSPGDVTISDSSSASWTGTVNPGTSFGGVAAVHYSYFASSPGSITVTANFDSVNNATVLVVRVLTGVDSTDPVGAISQDNFSGGNATQSITPTEVGSWLYGTANDDFQQAAPNPNGNTSTLEHIGDSSSSAWAFEYDSNPTTSLSAVTLGGSWSGDSGAIVLYEFRPAAGTNFEENVSDTLTLDDSGLDQNAAHTGDIESSSILSDTGADPDLTESQKYQENPADTETLSDFVSLTHNAVRGYTDTEGLSDSTELVFNRDVSVSDSLSLSDTVSLAITVQETFSDSLTSSDDVTTTVADFVDFTDTETLSDTADRVAAYTRGTSDTSELSDTASTTSQLNRIESDTESLSDQATPAITIVLTVTDVETLADVLSTQVALFQFETNVEELSDDLSTQASYTRGFSDTEGLSDSHSFALGEITRTDTVSLSDSTSITHITPDVSGEIGNYTTTLVVGPASVYVADFGATEPQGTEILSAPNGEWSDIGGTLEGVDLSIAQEYEDADFLQVPDMPLRRLKKRALSAKTVLAEPTLQNILYGLNSGTLYSGTGYESYTPTDMDEATELDYRAVMLYGWAPGTGTNGGHKRRVVIMRKCLSIDNVELGYKKDDQTGLAITWAVHRVDGSTAPFLIIDED